MSIRRRRPSWRSHGRSRRYAEQSNRTSRSMTCCVASMRHCGAGAATSGQGCPRQSSPTSTTICGNRFGEGCAVTPQVDLETTAPPLLRRRLVASQREPGTDQPGKDQHDRYRYRGAFIPSPWPAHRWRTPPLQPDRVLWRARCIERSKPGSGSGPGKRNSPNGCHRVPGRLSPTGHGTDHPVGCRADLHTADRAWRRRRRGGVSMASRSAYGCAFDLLRIATGLGGEPTA